MGWSGLQGFSRLPFSFLTCLSCFALLARSPISFDVGKNFSAFDDVDFSAATQQPDEEDDGDQDLCVLEVTQRVKIVA